MKQLLTLVAVLSAFAGFAQKQVTFIVDMRGYTGTNYAGVFVNGTWNNWCGTCNPLTDPENDSVWTTTLPLTADSVEYKFTLDGWTGQEMLTAGSACTKTTGTFTNRFARLNGDTILTGVCWQACASCTGVKYATWQVNMANVTVDTTGVYVAGGTGMGLPGDHKMALIPGTTRYTKTLRKPTGWSSDFTFLNGNCPSWGCKENLAGKSCAVGPYNDRGMSAMNSDFHLRTCFSECTTDGSCPAPATTQNITFQVDMTGLTSTFTNLYVSGQFNNWSGNANQMTDPDNDNIYTVTLPLVTGQWEYKYSMDNWASSEQLAPNSSDSLCTKTTGGFTNRVLQSVSGQNTTLPVVCYASCLACGADASLAEGLISARVFPNPAQGYFAVEAGVAEAIRVEVTNLTGQVVHVAESANGTARISTEGWAPAVYFVRTISDRGQNLARVTVQ
ncbi:MAG: T9SS type A sorting domain-containing protein [Schleiferiaceae bacterium]